ncbi:MAG: protein kinase [bacterium]
MTIDYEGREAQQRFAEDDPRLPESFQNYQIERKLGEGPTSFCYQAVKRDSRQQVRLKVLRKRVARLPQVREQIDLMNQRCHAYNAGRTVLAYHGWGSHDDNYFFEFDFIDAITLRELIDEMGPFHPDMVALFGLQLVSALAEVQGIKPSAGLGNFIPVHRDLKPENVLIRPDGKLVLADVEFNRLTTFAERQGLSLPQDPLCYESPELLLRDYADRRSDIFSLGMLLFELLCRGLPYVGRNINQTRQNIREERRRKLTELYPGSHSKERLALLRRLGLLLEPLLMHEAESRPQQLVDIESSLLSFLVGANYDDPAREISRFVREHGFSPQRKQSGGWLRRLFGG